MKVNLRLGDALLVLAELENESVDSIVTDPPYGLAFMGKKWDYDVPSQAIWEECLRVLKPGGHLLAFAGSRTYHRMAVRIEDAGFDIRDQLMWLYGSGFPKSQNIGKAIDKAAGAKREVVGIAGRSGTTRNCMEGGDFKGSAARYFYCAKASTSERHLGCEAPGEQFKHGDTLRKVEDTATSGNTHPTVKPIALMKHLIALVTPPGGTVLDPFMGSGTTGMAAAALECSFIGIEREEDFFNIAFDRVNYASKQKATA